MRNTIHHPNILSRPISSLLTWRTCLQTIVAGTMVASVVRAEEQSVRVSSLSRPASTDPGKSFLAYPAISVPSGAFSSSYAPPPPTPRSMPTSLSTAGWSPAPAESTTEEVAVTQPVKVTRAKTAATEEEAPAPKPKARAKTAVAEEEAPAPKPKARAKTAAAEEEALAPKPKAHAKTAAAEEEAPAPKPKAHAKTAAAEEEAPAPKPKAHAKTAAAEEEAPAPKPKAHAKAAATAEEAPAPKPRFHVDEAPEEKVVKEVMPVAPKAPAFRVAGSAGYYSHYMFRGLDVAYRTGIDAGNSSGFFASSAAVSLGDFTLGFWYEHSLDSYVPGGAGFDKSFGNLKDPLNFKTPARERYQEYDLFANYTFHLTPDLALTTGMNFYWFSDGRFWANGSSPVNSTTEAAASLNYTGIPYLNQTLSYYYDFDAFKGGYAEYKVATKPFELVRNGDFSISLIPSLTVAYDWRYNGSNSGWNHIEPAIDMPVRLTEGLTLNFGARYSADLGDPSRGANGQAVDRTDDRFWFTAAFQYTFPPGPGSALEYIPKDGKSMLEKQVEPPDDKHWRLSVGAGVRTIQSSFDVDPSSYKFDHQLGGGDLFFATAHRDAHYLDGSVFSATDRSFYAQLGRQYLGTSSFAFLNQSQFSNNGPSLNRQVTYHSDRYAYPEARDGFTSSHDDPTVYPYLKLSREVFQHDNFSIDIGLSYSYSRSESDSGSRIVGLSAEELTRSFFTYDLDEIVSNPKRDPKAPYSNYGKPYTTAGTSYDVIYDAPKFKNFVETYTHHLIDVPFAPPQSNRLVTTTTVATFRGSTLNTDFHNAAIPIELSVDVTPRLHANVSFGPTMNLLNSDLTTETFDQLIDGLVPTEGGLSRKTQTRPLFGNKVISLNPTGNLAAAAVLATLSPAAIPGAAKLLGTPAAGGAGQAAGSQTTSSQSGGGKGSFEARSRKLPGKTVGHSVNRSSTQDVNLGVFGQLGLQLDLDANRRWFVDLYARYEYAPEFSLADGVTNTSIDVSSFGGGIGLGFRF